MNTLEELISQLIFNEYFCKYCGIAPPPGGCESCDGYFLRDDAEPVELDYIKIVPIAKGVYPAVRTLVLYDKKQGYVIAFKLVKHRSLSSSYFVEMITGTYDEYYWIDATSKALATIFPAPCVKIEIQDGVLAVTKKPEGLKVIIVDYDGVVESVEVIATNVKVG
jgi:hypothetical protein